MKKLLLSLACMLGMGIAASAFNNSAVMLLHNGKMTTYEAEQINDAMEAAEDGDVVILTEGTFPTFKITKKITVRGVGEMTIINGDIDISIPGEPTLTANLLEFVKVIGVVYVNLPISRMVIKQCNVDYNSNSVVWIKAKTTDSYIDRCKIEDLRMYEVYTETVTVDGVTSTFVLPCVQGLTITNSVINGTWGVDNDNHPSNDGRISTGSTFLNCYIGRGEHSLGNVINSIIRYNQWALQCTNFVNTYFRKNQTSYNPATCTVTGCYFEDDSDLQYDSEDITTKGYLGNDGTIIGPMGGNTPYTLRPAVPQVTESSMKVDAEKKQLNVTLTVSPK